MTPTTLTRATDDAQSVETALCAENYRLREALQPPDGFGSWREAFLSEQLARVRAEHALAAAQESFATGDSWVIRDIAMQCAQRAAAQNNPFDSREDAQPFEPARWVLEAMRAAIRWDRKMNRDVQPATKGPG